MMVLQMTNKPQSGGSGHPTAHSGSQTDCGIHWEHRRALFSAVPQQPVGLLLKTEKEFTRNVGNQLWDQVARQLSEFKTVSFELNRYSHYFLKHLPGKPVGSGVCVGEGTLSKVRGKPAKVGSFLMVPGTELGS